MHDKTIIMLAFLNGINKNYGPLTIFKIGFRNKPEIDLYIHSINTSINGTNLFLADKVIDSIKNNEELTRFSIIMYFNQDTPMEVSFSHNFFKIEILTDKEKSKSREIAQKFYEIYESLY